MNHHEAMQQIRSDLNRYVAKPMNQMQRTYVRTLMNEMNVDQVGSLYPHSANLSICA